jgi:hypothetical protein
LASIEGSQTKLARLLRMLALEYPTGTSHSLQAAREVVLLDEECSRAHDAMCRVSGVANLHFDQVVQRASYPGSRMEWCSVAVRTPRPSQGDPPIPGIGDIAMPGAAAWSLA